MELTDYSALKMDYAQVKIWGRKATKRNPFNFVVAFICSSQDLGTWHRSMAHRGISTLTTLAQRPFTAHEREEQARKTRLNWLHYKDWETLIIDEYLETSDTDWIETLLTASKIPLTVEQVIIKALLP